MSQITAQRAKFPTATAASLRQGCRYEDRVVHVLAQLCRERGWEIATQVPLGGGYADAVLTAPVAGRPKVIVEVKSTLSLSAFRQLQRYCDACSAGSDDGAGAAPVGVVVAKSFVQGVVGFVPLLTRGKHSAPPVLQSLQAIFMLTPGCWAVIPASPRSLRKYRLVGEAAECPLR